MVDAIISGSLLGLALILSVGPVIFTIIKLRINYGLTSAFYFIGGVWLSDILWVLTANLFGEWLTKLVTYKYIIGAFGGAFLVMLGVYYLFFKKYPSKEEMDRGIRIRNSTHARLFITGFLINTLNPGIIALWFAAATNAPSGVDEKIVMFSICLLLNMCADFFKINLAGKLRKKLTEKNIMIINRISGLLFLAFGIALMIGVFVTSIKE
jgi:threonine/homoserine/homoserine lactone efflux protein